MKQLSTLLILLLATTALMAQVRINGNFAFQTNPSKKYSLYIPSSYSAATPNAMMVGMHPFNTSRWNAISWCDTLIAFAEANDLLLVCPDGGSNGNITDAIDYAFTTVLLDSVRNWYNIDTERTYIMGFSMGGRATYTYGLAHPNVFGGYLPIGAAISGLNEVNATLQANSNCRPVYIVHGSFDSPNTRYTPVRTALINAGAIVNSLLMSGVGHTIDFPNRNQILTTAFQWIDSVNTAPLQADAGTAFNSCAGVGVNIGAPVAAAGGQCPYTYSWSPSTGLSSPTAPNPLANPSINTTYTLTVTDGKNQVSTSQATVTVIAPPSLTVSANDSVCIGQNIQLTANSTGTITWNASASLSCTNCANPVATPTATTTYSAVATDGFGCQSTPESVTVSVLSLPIVTASPNTLVCAGSAVQLSATGSDTICWTPSVDLNCAKCINPLASPSVTTTYHVVTIDANGCQSLPDSVRVTVIPLPTLTISPDDSVCLGQSIRLTSMGSDTTIWGPATGLSCTKCPNPNASPTTTTTYTAITKDGNGCLSPPETVTITVMSLPMIVTGRDQDICLGDSAQLLGTARNPIHWSPSTGLSCVRCNNPTAAPAVTTLYVAVATDTNGCESLPDSTTVTVLPLPTTAYTVNVNGMIADFTNRSLSSTSWVWDFGDGTIDSTFSPMHTYQPGTYYACLTARNREGCTSMFCDSITILSTGIEAPVFLREIGLYPNPTRGALFLSIPDGFPLKPMQVSVMDLTGRELLHVTIPPTAPSTVHEVDLSAFAAGSYLLRMKTSKGEVVRKVEVLR